MKKPFIAGNWKMNPPISAGIELAKELKKSLFDFRDVEIVLIPPFTHLYLVKKEIEGTKIKLGAQNMHWEEKGAFTGEISPLMLKEIGCSYVIIGHSERRKYFGENDETVNKKARSALLHGLSPIICIGETLEEREKGITMKVVENQLRASIKGISEEEILKTVIAYEPVWAIGTGKVATPEIAQSMHAFIRKTVQKLYNGSVAESISVLYGGSVKPDNISGLYAMPDIDGVLVGGASLKVQSFLDIIQVAL